jgi:hypothetical protein
MAFFLYRDGYQIKRTKGDYEIAFHLHDEGYELFSRPLFTDQEVATEQRAWQERVDKMREQDASDTARLNLSFLGRGPVDQKPKPATE